MSILCSLFIISINTIAQESKPISTPTVPSEFKKNEISINTAPLFRVLLNSGLAEATRFSVSYKRNLSENSALRFTLVADMINSNAFNYNPWNEVIIIQSDSVVVKQVQVTPGYVSPHLNLGFEKLFGKHKLKWFYGTDLTIGYSENQSYIQNKTLIRDFSSGPNVWVEAQTFQADIISRSKTETFSLGLSPFFGAKYPLSKHFSLSAQVGVDMAVQNKNISVSNNLVTSNFHVTSFDFNQSTGFLNDISLVYKF